MVPDPVRVHDCDGTVLTNLQAIHLGAVDAVFSLREFQLRQPAFQILPRFDAGFFRRAFRLRLIRAQKNMASNISYSEVSGDLLQTRPGVFGAH